MLVSSCAERSVAEMGLLISRRKAENVANVKTSLVIRCAKDEPGLPFDVLEARLAKSA